MLRRCHRRRQEHPVRPHQQPQNRLAHSRVVVAQAFQPAVHGTFQSRVPGLRLRITHLPRRSATKAGHAPRFSIQHFNISIFIPATLSTELRFVSFLGKGCARACSYMLEGFFLACRRPTASISLFLKGFVALPAATFISAVPVPRLFLFDQFSHARKRCRRFALPPQSMIFSGLP